MKIHEQKLRDEPPLYMSDCPRCGAKRLYERACPQCGFPPHFPMHHSQALSDEELREWDVTAEGQNEERPDLFYERRPLRPKSGNQL